MATHADISGNLTIGALQSVRRNVTDTAFEAYTPASGGSGGGGAATTYPVVVANIFLSNQNTDIALTGIPNTDTLGLYRVSYYLQTTRADGTAAGYVQIDFKWTDETAERDTANQVSGVQARTIIMNSTNMVCPGTWPLMYVYSGSASYYIRLTSGTYGTAEYSVRIIAERLAEYGARTLSGTSAGSVTYRATLAAGMMQVRGTARGTATAQLRKT